MHRSARCALTTGLLLVATGLSAPAHGAGIPIPVNCSVDKVVLETDGLTYDLHGTCGVVVIAADDTDVTIPAARTIVVRGEGNAVHAKPADRVRVLGSHQEVEVVSVRALRVASPGSVVTVDGLVEEASVGTRRTRLTADQINQLVVDGHGHRVRARRGYVVRVPGSHNELGFRRLEQARLPGDDNTLRVRRGRTQVRNGGEGNTIRVHRRA